LEGSGLCIIGALSHYLLGETEKKKKKKHLSGLLVPQQRFEARTSQL
jgi:hypothetical protein